VGYSGGTDRIWKESNGGIRKESMWFRQGDALDLNIGKTGRTPPSSLNRAGQDEIYSVIFVFKSIKGRE